MATKARLIAKAFNITNGEASLRGQTARALTKVTNAVAADSNAATIDTFDGTTIRAAQYFITANTAGDSSHQAQQIYVTHNGDSATLVSYGTLLHNDVTIVSYDATIDGNDTISLVADPQISNGLKFSFERIDVEKV